MIVVDVKLRRAEAPTSFQFPRVLGVPDKQAAKENMKATLAGWAERIKTLKDKAVRRAV
jgi:hypothetical protein